MKRAVALAVLALPLTLTGYGYPFGGPQRAAPPSTFTEIGQQGFRDGYDAASDDVAHKEPPDIEKHLRFRHPPVWGPGWDDYRHGFREGYYRAFLRKSAPPPPPAEFNEAARQGFHDGYEAAKRDVGRYVPLGVEKNPKFRSPPMAPPAWEDYRHGFREGYQALLHQAPPPGL